LFVDLRRYFGKEEFQGGSRFSTIHENSVFAMLAVKVLTRRGYPKSTEISSGSCVSAKSAQQEIVQALFEGETLFVAKSELCCGNQKDGARTNSLFSDAVSVSIR